METRPGQGTFVVEKAVPFVTTLPTQPDVGSSEGAVYQRDAECTPSVSPTEVAIIQADVALALELGLSEGDEVVSRRQKRYVQPDSLVAADLVLPDEPGRAGSSALDANR